MQPTWQKYYDRVSELHLRNPWYREQVERYILGQWRSDASSDPTTRKLIARVQRARAVIIVKQVGVLAGVEEAVWLLRREGLTVKILKTDGAAVQRQQVIAHVVGNARAMLGLERTVLNVLQRLSGIATMTAQCVERVGGRGSKRPLICATRKTQWGALDKRAVSWGGGYTHRLGLFDGVLVKDNHLALADHTRLQTTRWGQTPTALEIASLSELKRAVLHYPQFKVLLLDNFTPTRLRLLVRWLEQQHLRKRYILEASGGITLNTAVAYSKTGVDALSLGVLTHSSPALDISLDCLPV